MNPALSLLKRMNPEIYSQFIHLLSQDLGLESELQGNSLMCPNCSALLKISISPQEQGKVGKRVMKRIWVTKPDSLFGLLVQVARLKKMTTGKVSAEFNKAMKPRIKGLDPKKVREIKIKWLKAQLSRGRRRAA